MWECLSFLLEKKCWKIFCIFHSVWERTNFIIRHEWLEKRLHGKAFEHTQAFLPTEYLICLRWEKFRTKRMVNSQNKCWLVLSTQDELILMKTKHPVHIIVFELIISGSDVIPQFTFSHGIRYNMETYKCLEKVVLGGCLKTLHLATGFCAMPTNRGTHNCRWENICDLITPNGWPPNSLDYNLIVYITFVLQLN